MKQIKMSPIPPLSKRISLFHEGKGGFKNFDIRCWKLPNVPYEAFEIGSPIKHHKPSFLYKYLWTYDNTYPVKRFRPFCGHENLAIVEVHNSDPGSMTTDYVHLVCTDCGKVIKVGKTKIKIYLKKHGIDWDELMASYDLWKI